jgi:hypothetical protein
MTGDRRLHPENPIRLKGMITPDGKLDVQLPAGLAAGEVEITLTRPADWLYDEHTLIIDAGFRVIAVQAKPNNYAGSQGTLYWCLDLLDYLKNEHKLLIGLPTAEKVLFDIGSALKLTPPRRSTVKGRNLVTGLPDQIELNSDQVYQFLERDMQSLVQSLEHFIKHGIFDHETRTWQSLSITQIVLKGEYAGLKNLDKLIEQTADLPVIKG